MPTRCPQCELRERTAEDAVLGAPLIIADGLAGEWYGDTQIAKKHFASVKIASSIPTVFSAVKEKRLSALESQIIELKSLIVRCNSCNC